nr:hypothetical protein [Amycolatopsis sp. DSM 110486]
MHCGICHRRLDSHWNHGRPTYRCRHGHRSTQGPTQTRPKTLYIREDHLIDQISIRLGDQTTTGHNEPAPNRTQPSRIATALRTSGTFVICDHAGCRLETINST